MIQEGKTDGWPKKQEMHDEDVGQTGRIHVGVSQVKKRQQQQAGYFWLMQTLRVNSQGKRKQAKQAGRWKADDGVLMLEAQQRET